MAGGTPRPGPKAAILGSTMGEYPDFRKPDRDEWDDSEDREEAEPELSMLGKQELAHERGRICKKRGCVVCAPLVERRRLRKKERQAEAQAALHEKGRPCGRSSCELPVCVEARQAAEAEAASPTVEPRSRNRRDDESREHPDRKFRREVDRHRAGLPCGSEDCPNQECIDGFAIERTRRHRARRPCRSTTCDNAICVAGRSKH